MSDFGTDTQMELLEDGRVRGHVSGDWNHFMGILGGYMVGIALRSAALVVDPDVRPSSISVQFLSPATEGPLDGIARVLRRGRASTFVLVELVQGAPLLSALVTFVKRSSESPTYLSLVRPEFELAFDDAIVGHNLESPLWSSSLHGRRAFKDADSVYGSSGDAYIEWLCFKDTDFAKFDHFVGAAACAPLADLATIAGTFSAVDWLRSRWLGVSVDLTMHFHSESKGESLYLVKGKGTSADQGIGQAEGAVWSSDGRLLATAYQQTTLRRWK